MLRTFTLAFALATALTAGAAFAATPYAVDSAKSTLNFTATQTGSPVEGQFKKFTATIVFADEDLKNSRFDVTIDVKSVDTGEDDRDDALRGEDLFATDKHPTARFVTTGFIRKAAGQYEAAGKLTLRGVTRDIRFPFTLASANKETWLKGAVTLNRLDYGVGQGDWKDTAWVANEVKVSFALKLTPGAKP